MELRVLNYFLAVAREESFTKAAQQLHVTQPTLSRQIADLEQELGVKLFVRSNHNIILTEDGMLLKHRAQEILSLADKTKRDFLEKGEALSGTISIGSGEFRSTEYLAKIIAEFRKKYPNVKYEVYSGNAGNIRDYIERGFIDIGLMSEPMDERKYNFVNMPIKEQWGLFVPSDSPLSEKQSIGYGRMLPFLRCTNEIFMESGVELPLPGQATTTLENRLEKGAEAQAAIFGEHMKEAWKAGHINRWLAENCFGDYYTRKGLTLAERELITFCFLMAQGGCEPQLIAHSKGNINMGNDKDFLLRVVSQCLPYIGYPRSLNAIACINKAAEGR